jgi:hemerythrin
MNTGMSPTDGAGISTIPNIETVVAFVYNTLVALDGCKPYLTHCGSAFVFADPQRWVQAQNLTEPYVGKQISEYVISTGVASGSQSDSLHDLLKKALEAAIKTSLAETHEEDQVPSVPVPAVAVTLVPCVVLTLHVSECNDVQALLETLATTFGATMCDIEPVGIESSTLVVSFLFRRMKGEAVAECVKHAVVAYEHFNADMHTHVNEVVHGTVWSTSAAPQSWGVLSLTSCVVWNDTIVACTMPNHGQIPTVRVQELSKGSSNGLLAQDLSADYFCALPSYDCTKHTEDVSIVSKRRHRGFGDTIHMLSAYASSTFLGLEEEKAAILEEVKHTFESKSSKVLYIVGPPGAGHERLLDASLTPLPRIQRFYVNCATMKDRGSIRPVRRLVVQLVRADASMCGVTTATAFKSLRDSLIEKFCDATELLSFLRIHDGPTDSSIGSPFPSAQSLVALDESPATPSRRQALEQFLTFALEHLLRKIPRSLIIVDNAHALSGISKSILVGLCFIQSTMPCQQVWLCDATPPHSPVGKVVVIRELTQKEVLRTLQHELRNTYYKPVQASERVLTTLTGLCEARSTLLKEVIALLVYKRRLPVNLAGDVEISLDTASQLASFENSLGATSAVKEIATDVLATLGEEEGKCVLDACIARTNGNALPLAGAPEVCGSLVRRGVLNVVDNGERYTLSRCIPVTQVLNDRRMCSFAARSEMPPLSSFVAPHEELSPGLCRRSSQSNASQRTLIRHHSNGPDVDPILHSLGSIVNTPEFTDDTTAALDVALMKLSKLSATLEDAAISQIVRELRESKNNLDTSRDKLPAQISCLCTQMSDLHAGRVKLFTPDRKLSETPCALKLFGCQHNDLLESLRTSLIYTDKSHEALENLARNVLRHLSDEDAMMTLGHYPHCEEHIWAHQSLARLLGKSLIELSSMNMAYIETLRLFCEQWEGVHLETTDVSLWQWFMEQSGHMEHMCRAFASVGLRHVVPPHPPSAESPPVVLTVTSNGWKPKSKRSAGPPPT